MAKTSTVPKYFIQSIPDLGVTSQKLATYSVITTKVADSAITPAKADLKSNWDFTNGQVKVASPTSVDDAVPKRYVDAILSVPTIISSGVFNVTDNTVDTTLEANAVIDKISIYLTTQLNGTTGALLTVSAVNAGTTILSLTQNDLQTTNSFVYLGGYINGSTTDTIRLSLIVGDSSIGAGRITITTIQT